MLKAYRGETQRFYALVRVAFLQISQVELRDLFRNEDATEFCIVTIPTQLAIAESKRLLLALNTQGIAVRNIVVNQVCTEKSANARSCGYWKAGTTSPLLRGGCRHRNRGHPVQY